MPLKRLFPAFLLLALTVSAVAQTNLHDAAPVVRVYDPAGASIVLSEAAPWDEAFLLPASSLRPGALIQTSPGCKLWVTVVDPVETPIPQATVRLDAPAWSAVTDKAGKASLEYSSRYILTAKVKGIYPSLLYLGADPCQTPKIRLRVAMIGEPTPIYPSPNSSAAESLQSQAPSATEDTSSSVALSLHLVAPTKTIDLSLNTLKTLRHQSVTVTNGHSGVKETYSGVPLIDLLEKVGAPEPAAVKGKVLSDYIVATGSDNYHAVLSLAEIEPGFHPGAVIVADTLDGKPLDTQQGPLKLVVEEDKKPARWVHNLVKIELKQVE